MNTDLRDTPLFKEVEALYTTLRQPGTGQISDAAEISVSPDGRCAAFAATLFDKLEGSAPTRIALTDLTNGNTRMLTFGPGVDRFPKFSPDGRHIAFLSDRRKAGDFQLYLLDPASGAAKPTPAVEGWVEYLHWSPDGKRILLGVAGHGADVAGGQGGIASKLAADAMPSWMPAVDAGDATYRWRRAWVYALDTDSVRQVCEADMNIWEATWCGNDALAVVASPGPSEGLWYSARLHIVQVKTGEALQVYAPKNQLGWPAASPSGERLAVVEALCSDRWIVAGDLQLIDTSSRKVKRVDTGGVDITYTEWRSDQKLLLAGHRGFETVVGVYDIASGEFSEVWCSSDISTGGRYVTVSGLGEAGDCVLVGESFVRAPEIAAIRKGKYYPVKSFDLGFALEVKALKVVERVTWEATDGLAIQGWLLRPHGDGPHALVVNVHGGPVWHLRPSWMGRGVLLLALLKHGYAVFCPNPRGSSGRGQEFVRHVYGDLGGADAQDLLSGVDALVAMGEADPKRIGITGASYGGFMTCWLITQDARFAAAVPVAPHTNQVSEHLLSNIPHFMALFLGEPFYRPGGKYFDRSPIMHAHKVTTPTLNICGALDRCTPPEEARQFHSALQEHDVKSVLVTYPEEGHGIRAYPATIDYAARVVAWFQEHMPATPSDAELTLRS